MGIEIKVPAIRFKGFNDEWEEKILGNVTDYKNGKGHEDKQKSFGKYELINLNSISIDGGLKTSGKFVDETDSTLEKDDLVMVLSDVAHGDLLGRVALIPKSNTYVLNQRVALLRPHSVISPLFILYNINAHQSYFKSRGAGMSQLNISKSSVENFSSYIPEKTEQTKVGNYFQQLDGLIALHQQKHDKLLNLKKSLLEKMFPKQGQKVPEIRFKGFNGSWISKRLDENAVFLKGQGYSKNDLIDSGSPIILYGRLYTKYETVISIVDTFVKDNGNSIASKGNEVIVPASGETAEDIARASAVMGAGILLGSDLNIIYPNNEIDSTFLAISMSNGKIQKDISKRAQGKSVVHIRNADLKEITIHYPNKNEQKKISNYFQQIDELLNKHQAQLKKLNNIKQACVEKMFV